MLIRSPSHPGKSVSPAPYTVTWELSENVAPWSAQPTSQDRHSDKLPRETHSCWKSAVWMSQKDVGSRESCEHRAGTLLKDWVPASGSWLQTRWSAQPRMPTQPPLTPSEPGPRGLCVYAHLPDPAGLPSAEV